METATLVRQLGLWSNGRGPLQQKLARALMDVIRHGDIAPGLRLPSERALAGALQISRTTVVAAYDALREHGLAGQPRRQWHLGVRPVSGRQRRAQFGAGVGAGGKSAARPARSARRRRRRRARAGNAAAARGAAGRTIHAAGRRACRAAARSRLLPVRPAGAAAGNRRRVLQERPADGSRAGAGHQRRAACVHALRDAARCSVATPRSSRIRPTSAPSTPAGRSARESPPSRSGPAAPLPRRFAAA